MTTTMLRRDDIDDDAGLLAGCSAGSTTRHPWPRAPATRTVEHPLGSVQLPVRPGRVVVTNINALLDAAAALGVVPVGSLEIPGAPARGFPTYVLSRLPDPTAVMSINEAGFETDFETVARLDPDVIVHATNDPDSYPRYSEIAPPVALAQTEVQHNRLPLTATALGREREGAALLAEIDAAAIGAATVIPDATTVSVLLRAPTAR